MATAKKPEMTVHIQNNSLHICIGFCCSGMLRLRANHSGDFRETETLVVLNPVKAEWDSAEENENGITILYNGLRADIIRSPFCLTLFNAAGEEIFSTVSAMFRQEDGLSFRYRLQKEERLYGLGQSYNERLNIRGKMREIWNQWDHDNCGSAGIPFLYSSKGYALLLNTSWATRMLLGGNEPSPKTPLARPKVPWADRKTPDCPPDECAIITEGDELDIFLIPGHDYAECALGYRRLTSEAQLPPRWALEYIQSKFGYISQDELLHVARKFVERGIPCSAFMLDITIYKYLGDLVMDKISWPDPASMIRVLNRLGMRLIAGQHPFIDERSLNYAEFAQAGCLIDWTPPKEFEGVTSWYGHAFDFSNPEGMRLWWEKVKALFDSGVSGYWSDMGELEIHPEDATPQYMGVREKMQNLYSLTWARALYTGQKSYADKRLFIVMRTMYAGIARYGVCTWSGDVDSTFEMLDRHVVIGQQVCLSGQPWWCSDVGGFQDTGGYYDPELFIRWLQWGTFCPIMRIHGQRDTDPWAYGDYYEPIITWYIRLRYSLMPYIYAHARQTVDTGMPVMRALAIIFPDDEEAVENDHEFMFGDSILVAPVTRKGERTHRLYLPGETWYGFYDDTTYEGGHYVTVDAPLARIPLFVRAGAVIARAADDRTALHVYAGADGTGTLYEDDGESFGYERGEFARTEVVYNDNAKTVTISPAVGTYCGQPASRSFDVVFHDVPAARVVHVENRRPDEGVTVSVFRGEAYPPPQLPDSPVDLQPGAGSCIVTFSYPDTQYRLPVGWHKDENVHIANGVALLQNGGTRTANGYLTITKPEAVRIPLGTGWITWWKVVGVYEAGIQGFHEVFAPEKSLEISSSAVENGMVIHRHENLWHSGFVDLKKLFGVHPGEREMTKLTHRTAYAGCVVTAERDMDAYVQVMADDRLKIWFNGDLVGLADENYTRESLFRIQVRKGENRLFVKCSQWITHMWKEYSARAWGFNLRILDEDRCVSEELLYSLD